MSHHSVQHGRHERERRLRLSAEGAPRLSKTEEIEVVEFTIDEVKQLLRDNKIEQAMHVACIFYALEKINALQY